jgi:hypothetical protein
MKRSKKKQRHAPNPGKVLVVKIPTWRSGLNKRARETNEDAESHNKASRPNIDSDAVILSKFYDQIKRRLISKIVHCRNTGGDIDALYLEQSQLGTLEPGVVTTAEEQANYPAATIENCLTRNNRKEKTKTIDRWNSFVNSNFYDIVEEAINVPSKL